MRRYAIEVDGRPYEVEVEDSANDRFRVQVEGRAFEVTLGAVDEVHGAGPAAAPTASPAAMPRPAARAPAPAPATAAAGAAVLAAPMPGRILRIEVAAGAAVVRGQDIAVLEAMKMENVLRATQDGVVAEVCVHVGDQVAHGQAIVRFGAGA